MVLPLPQSRPVAGGLEFITSSASPDLERADLASDKPDFAGIDHRDRAASTELFSSNLLAWACLPQLERSYCLYYERRPLFSALTIQL